MTAALLALVFVAGIGVGAVAAALAACWCLGAR